MKHPQPTRRLSSWTLFCDGNRRTAGKDRHINQPEKSMKKLMIALALAVTSAAAYAACTTHTYVVNGRIVTCTTCCFGSNCTTNCI